MDTIAQTRQTNTQTEQTTPATTAATATNTTQTLSWFTSRNTVIGGLIFAAFGTIVYYVQSIINRKEHKVNKKVDEQSARSLIDYRNQAQLDFVKQKYELCAFYEKRRDEQDTAPDEDIAIQPTMSFAQMESRPLANESGWVIPGYAKKGQISVCVACADIGKSICTTDGGISAALGVTPSFLPKDAPRAEQMDVLMYRLEARAGEMNKRYGDGSMFPHNFQWVLGGQLTHFTQGGLISDIASRSKIFTKDTLVIIDPYTKLPDWDASQFISEMGKVRTECANRGVVISFLITAHADETPDWRPLTSKDIRGGDLLIQQADAVFALRKERSGDGYRFMQTLKVPKGEADRSTVNVIRFVGRDEAVPGSYTHLEFVCEKKISEALPLRPKALVKDGDGKPAEKPKKPGKLAGKEEGIIRSYNDGIPVKQIAKTNKVSAQAIYDVLDKAGVKRKRSA